MAVITINGKKLEVPDNKRILDCALDAGIYIPHLCHHPDLSELGSCRMCIVNLEGQDKPVTSCTLKAKDGMEIKTESDEIIRLRRLALELILAGHPECTSCPKYGNCELQMLIQYVGPKTGRMHERTKGFKTEDANPMFIHDMNRCIVCGRCVRACNELRGVEVLQYKKKELETYVGTLHDQLLSDADCRFCGACVEVCPTGTIRDKIQAGETQVSKEDAAVPCSYACPAHTDVPRYVRFAKEGKYDEAAAVIREKVPFPNVLGHICNHVCELDCNRGEVNEAISIRNIKRQIAAGDTGLYWKGKGKQLESTGQQVCVVGAGPAGLTAAYYLKKQGHDVTIKEAMDEPGGMLRYGIPEYRLPRSVIAEEVAVIRDAGVKMEVGTRVESLTSLKNSFDAVLMTIGGHKGIRLPIEGNDLPGVLVNTEFLRKAAAGEDTGIGEDVIVLGGGNVAFDCARTAIRLGAKKVSLACLESRENMPADLEEIEQGQEEGIVLYPGRTFERITGDQHADGVELMKVKSFTFDENRRPLITKEEDSQEKLCADTIIFAVGQKPELVDAETLETNRGYLVVDKELKTTSDGIFAAGDVVYGTSSVVKAIASGRQAAQHIDIYLGGDGDIKETLAPVQKVNAFIGRCPGFGNEKRQVSDLRPVDLRKDNFELVDLGLGHEKSCQESERCLQCDLRLKIQHTKTWSDYSELEEEV